MFKLAVKTLLKAKRNKQLGVAAIKTEYVHKQFTE
jgi:hypothetical protein